MSEPYRDPWIDYKAICESLKKKFLKKPNYARALTEFSSLALRLQDEECEHYAAMCYFQMAKIYENMGDWNQEYSHLLKAARMFLKAEFKSSETPTGGSPDCLNHVQDCFCKASKIILSQNGVWLAGLHLTELGSALYTLGHPRMAVKYLTRGARLLEVEHYSRIAALSKLAECQCELEMYSDALATVDELWTTHMKNAVDPKFGHGRELLKNCEIACVLLLINAKCNDMSARHRLLLSMYAEDSLRSKREESEGTEGSSDIYSARRYLPPKDSALPGEEFIRFYDFVIAIRKGNVDIAKRNFSFLEPILDDMCVRLAAKMLSTIRSRGHI